jgi:hypothetical protein
MIQPVVAEAARQLGLPPGLLRGLSAHPDLVAMVERELAGQGGVGRPGYRGPASEDRPRGPTWRPGCAMNDEAVLAAWLRDETTPTGGCEIRGDHRIRI